MVTLTQVKAILGINYTSADTQLQAILDSVNGIIEDVIGDISEGTKKMQVVKSTIKHNTIALNIINPTQITKIDVVDFSDKVNGDDYIIYSDGLARIKDLSDYITSDFDVFEVEFLAGFNEVPKSLISAVANYVGYIYSQDMGKDVLSEQLGPRSVSYSGGSGNSESGASPELKRFRAALRKYIPLCLRVY